MNVSTAARHTRGGNRGRAAIACLLALLVVTGCFGGGAEEVKEPEPTSTAAAPATELNIYTWPDNIPPSVIANFEQTFGVTVNYYTHKTIQEQLDTLRAGNTLYDLIIPLDGVVSRLIDEGLLEKLNLDNVPNRNNLEVTFRSPPFDPGGIHCVAFTWGTLGLAYNSTVVEEDIDSWQALLNDKYAGRVAWLNEARAALGVVQLLQNNNLNASEPAVIAAAKERILATDREIITYNSPAELTSIFPHKVDIVLGINGDFAKLIAEDPSIRYLIPNEGSAMWLDSLCIPVGAPHKTLAEAFINYLLEPQPAADAANYLHFATPNTKALPMITGDDLLNPGIYPPPSAFERMVFFQDVGDAAPFYEDAWAEIKERLKSE